MVLVTAGIRTPDRGPQQPGSGSQAGASGARLQAYADVRPRVEPHLLAARRAVASADLKKTSLKALWFNQEMKFLFTFRLHC